VRYSGEESQAYFEQIVNAKKFLEDLSSMKATPDREQGLQLCRQAVEKELRRLEQKRG
jgi:hypothetical protein